MYEFKDDLNIILKTLDISIHDLASDLHFDVPTISNWLTGKYLPDLRSKEDIYEYAYRNNVKLNLAYEEAFKVLGKKDKFIPIYHGSKKGIDGEIDLKHSKDRKDFGKGFYAGDNLIQSLMFVSDYKDSVIYGLGLYNNNLKKHEYKIDNEWMITIAYYRGLLDDYKDSKKLKKIIKISEEVDYIIAPIANNRMFDIIGEFTEGRISDEACRNALAALNLGKQYVFKTEKALKKIGLIKEFYLCNSEKEFYKNESINNQKERYSKIKNFRSKYRKGKYIEELL